MVRSRSYIAIPPGTTIKEQLFDRGMSQKEFAVRMDMSEKHISKLINGEVQLTPETAVRLEMVLGLPAKFWNNLEAIYREKLIKVENENKIDSDTELSMKIPYKEMVKMGWVPATRDPKERVVILRKYFELVELALLNKTQLTQFACRRLDASEKGDLALLSWAQAAKLEARKVSTSPVNIRGLADAIPSIRRMTTLKSDVLFPELKEYLAQYGIALVFLPHLKGSLLQGVTFIDGKKIVIGLIARNTDSYEFWFSLFHEIAHIILGHISQSDGTSEDDELAADRWAADELIPAQDFEEYKKTRNFSEPGIIGFANEQGIAPDIVVGRLQSEKLIKRTALNNLKETYHLNE